MRAVWGLLMTYAGFVSWTYGRFLNRDWGELLRAAFSNTKTPPGQIYIYVGIGLAVVGGLLIVDAAVTIGQLKRKKQ